MPLRADFLRQKRLSDVRVRAHWQKFGRRPLHNKHGFRPFKHDFRPRLKNVGRKLRMLGQKTLILQAKSHNVEPFKTDRQETDSKEQNALGQ